MADSTGGYDESVRGYRLPPAYNDDFGGRPGLDANTVLGPPLDDPTYDELLDAADPSGRLAAPIPPKPESPRLVQSPEKRASAQRINTVVPPLPVPSARTAVANPPVVQEPAVDLHADSVAPSGPVDVEALITALTDHPQLVERLTAAGQVNANGQADEATQLAPAPVKPTWIPVIMQGEFGRFKSKAADVVICDSHVALLYTGEPGDEDLAFEPPFGMKFELKVPLSDGTFKTFWVEHFGLTTPLSGVGMLVVLPLGATPAAEGEQEHEMEHESGI